MKKIYWMICMIIVTLLVGCSDAEHSGDANADMTIAVASENVFDDEGYYHVKDRTLVYIDQNDSETEICRCEESELLYDVLYHRNQIYILSAETMDVKGKIKIIYHLKKWNDGSRKLELVADIESEDNDIYTIRSVVAAGNHIYYTLDSVEENFNLKQYSFGYGKSQLWKLDIKSGKKKKIFEQEGTRDAFNNWLSICPGDYTDTDQVTMAYTYCVEDDAQERSYREMTQLYALDVRKNTVTEEKSLTLGGYTNAYQTKDKLYYYTQNTDTEQYDLCSLDMSTGESKVILSTSWRGNLFSGCTAFMTEGQDANQFLYLYDQDVLLVGKDDIAKTERMIAGNTAYIATDSMDYSQLENQTEDMGIYGIVQRESYIRDHYEECKDESKLQANQKSDTEESSDRLPEGTYSVEDNKIICTTGQGEKLEVYTPNTGVIIKDVYLYHDHLIMIAIDDSEEKESREGIYKWERDEHKFLSEVNAPEIMDIAFSGNDLYYISIYDPEAESGQDTGQSSDSQRFLFGNINLETDAGNTMPFPYDAENVHYHNRVGFDAKEYGEGERLMITETYQTGEGKQQIHYEYENGRLELIE